MASALSATPATASHRKPPARSSLVPQAGTGGTGKAFVVRSGAERVSSLGGTGSSCRTCKDVALRTSRNQCAECNRGDRRVLAWVSYCSDASSCKVCCKDLPCRLPAGFLLTDDSTCQPILCKSGTGALCKKCQNVKDSTADVLRWQGCLSSMWK